MNISDFGLILLNGAYIGILWLLFISCIETPFSPLLHHSSTPILLEVFFQARPDSSKVALQRNIINFDRPNPDRLRSFSGPALLPGRARRSVWKI
jgi:hypothetical protein